MKICDVIQAGEALGCAIEEINTWIDRRGSTETYERVSEHLEVLADNADTITELMVDLLARWKPEEQAEP